MQQPVLQFAQSILRTPAVDFIFVIRLIGQQLAKGGINALAFAVDVRHAVLLTFAEQRRFRLNNFIQQRLCFGVFNHVTVKEIQPATQTVQ
ncbi:hypothetical protein SRABI106_03693 [Rahnella aquatilis]|nr:hypothetical protein SRABI106_03693 [Rahnella aquatilis]